MLELARQHMDMEGAFLAEFRGGDEVIRALAGDPESFNLDHDTGIWYQESPSRWATERTPAGLVPDVANDERIRELLFTRAAGVGSYIGVPVKLPDGRIYGSLFCLSHTPRPRLDERDVTFLRGLAMLLGEELARTEQETSDTERKSARIRSVLDHGEGFSMSFQPIFDLREGQIVGLEALSRFAAPPPSPPDRWFAEAEEVGLGVELEVTAVRAAIERVDELPGGAYLAVNVSPAALVTDALREALAEAPGERLVVEVTEHARVDDYRELRQVIGEVRRSGARLAVDDVGAGFASLRHVIRLAPDIIKLDITLTRDIDSDPLRRSLASSFITFAAETNATITAEGIETREEMDALRTLGVGCGQGFFLAHPGPLDGLGLASPVRRAG